MTGWLELIGIIGKVIVWWITKNETNKAAVIEVINRKQQGWDNESAGAIFDDTKPA